MTYFAQINNVISIKILNCILQEKDKNYNNFNKNQDVLNKNRHFQYRKTTFTKLLSYRNADYV